MNNLVKRLCSISIVAVMAVSLFSGCKKEEKKPTDSQSSTSAAVSTEDKKEEPKGIQIDPNKNVNLKFFTSAPFNKTELDETLVEFYKKYPNIKVEVVLIQGEEYRTKVKTSMVAGEQIDVLEASATGLERTQADSMYLPLDDYVKMEGIDLEKEYGDTHKQFVVGGKLYGIPKYVSPAGVWYNKKHFDEAKMPYPTDDWTWDDFFDIAKKLTIKDDKGKVTRYGAYNWLFASNGSSGAIINTANYGGWQLLKEDGTLNLDDPKFKKSLELFYNATMVEKSMPDLAMLTAEKLHYMYDMYKGRWSMLVSARNTAMFFDVHRENGQLPAEDDDAGIYQLAPMPRWDKDSPKKLSHDIAVGSSIAKGSKFQDEAFVFIRWFTTDSLVLSSKISHRVPASKILDMNLLMENWSYYKNKDGQIVKGKDRTELFKKVLDPEIKAFFPENEYKFAYYTQMTDELEKECSLLYTGAKSVDQALEGIKTALQKVYDKEAKK